MISLDHLLSNIVSRRAPGFCRKQKNSHKCMSETIQDRIFRVISTSRRIPLNALRPNCTFEELGVDSLDRLNILFDLESEFEIHIDDEQAKKATKVSDIIAEITQLVEAAGLDSPNT